MTDENDAAKNADRDGAEEVAGDGLANDGVAGELESLRQQAADNWSQYLRAVAELDNVRKRNAREVENARRYGIERFVAAILPVRDSLEAGLNAAREADVAEVEISALLEGEEATLRLLDQALEGAGIVEIDPVGEPFDPEQHEAMSLMPSASLEPNSVMAVVQKGYSLHGRIVRPARVIVVQAPPEFET